LGFAGASMIPVVEIIIGFEPTHALAWYL